MGMGFTTLAQSGEGQVCHGHGHGNRSESDSDSEHAEIFWRDD